MNTKTTLADLTAEADALARVEHLVETNEGTYGGREAVRKVRTADPAFANYHIYETVGSAVRRRTGCDAERAPGRARRINVETMAADRRRLADLRKRIRESR